MKKINVIFFLAMMVLAGGCSLGGGTTDQVETPVCILSVYNANADEDAEVDMSLNSVQVNNTPIAYKTFLDYFQLDPGEKTIKFTTTSSGTKVIDTSFTLVNFKAYSLFVTKRNSSAKVISILTLDEGMMTTNTNTMVRFINLSPDSPDVDVKLVGESNVFASNVPFMLMTPYKELAPVDFTVKIVRSSDGTELQTVQLSSTSSGYYQTIVLSGYNSSPVGGANTLTTKVLHN